MYTFLSLNNKQIEISWIKDMKSFSAEAQHTACLGSPESTWQMR